LIDDESEACTVGGGGGRREAMSNREATRAGLVMWCYTRELVERERERERAISSIDGLEDDDEYREQPH